MRDPPTFCSGPGQAALRRGRTGEGHTRLLTICTHRRGKLFNDCRLGRLVVYEMRRLHDTADVESLAWVVMPDHWHWLFSLSDTRSLADVVRLVKGRSARSINLTIRATGPVWQPGYHDRAIRTDADLRQVAKYVIENPLRAGLVNSPGDYPLWDCAWVMDPGTTPST